MGKSVLTLHYLPVNLGANPAPRNQMHKIFLERVFISLNFII